MREVLYIRISLSEAELLVREFDGNLDGRLSSQEFYQFCLPATSLSLRDIALNRGNLQSYSYKFASLLPSTQSQLGDLIQKELRFLRVRGELKRELMNHYDFLKSKYFNQISRDKVFITVDDIIEFLKYNGFRPTTEDLESILRRCDHSGDQLLSYSEFSEMTAFVENLSAIDIQGGSPSSLAKRDQVSYSPVAGRVTPGLGGSADRYERVQTFGGSPLRVGAQGARDGTLKIRTTPLERNPTEEDVRATPAFFGGQRPSAAVEDGPRSQLQEEEKKEGEEESVAETPAEEDFEANKPQELKFCFFLKMQLRIDKNTEIHKEVLSSNTQFNVREAFRMFD